MIEAGARLGPFELVEVIARGSSAAVWKARHTSSGVTAAIKVFEPDRAGQAHREAALLGRISHPGVVRVLATSSPGDVPEWFAMEHLDAPSLRARLDGGAPPSPQEVARIVAGVAGALAAVHAAGAIHGDVKPDNVIVVGTGATAATVLIDAGTARGWAPIGDDDDATLGRRTVPLGGARAASHEGSPAYAAPECWSSPDRADPRADQYALAIMAFELLAGQLPFEARDLDGWARAHARGELPRGVLAPAVSAVLARALAKRPEARFPEVAAFALAFERALAPPHAWSRRHRTAAAAAIVGAAVAGWTASPRDRATTAGACDAPDWASPSQATRAVVDAWTAGDLVRLRAALPAALDPANPDLTAARYVASRLADWIDGGARRVDLGPGPVEGAAVADDGTRAVVARGSRLELLELPSGVRVTVDAGAAVSAVAISADGQVVASGGHDGTVHTWRAITGDRLATSPPTGERVERIAVSSRGDAVALGTDHGHAAVWTPSTGAVVEHDLCQGRFGTVVFSPDGLSAAYTCEVSSGFLVLRAATGEPVLRSETGSGSGPISFLPSGSVAVQLGRRVEVHRAGIAAPLLYRHPGAAGVWDIDASGGDRIIVAWSDGLVDEYATDDDAPLRSWRFPALSPISAVRASPAGGALLLASEDGSVYTLDRAGTLERARAHGERILALTATAGRAVSVGEDGVVWIQPWRLRPPVLDVDLGAPVRSAAFSATGRELYAVSDRRIVVALDAATGRERWAAGTGTSTVGGPVELSASEAVVVTMGTEVAVFTPNLARTSLLVGHTDLVTAVSLGQDERVIATGALDGTVRIWDSEGHLKWTLEAEAPVWDVALSRDDAHVVAVDDRGRAHVWSTTTGALDASWAAAQGPVTAAAWGACDLILTGSRAGEVRAWHPDGRDHGHLGSVGARQNDLACSADGLLGAAIGGDGFVSVWHLPSGLRVDRFRAHADRGTSLGFAPDGASLVTTGVDQRIRIWRVAVDHRPLDELRAAVAPML